MCVFLLRVGRGGLFEGRDKFDQEKFTKEGMHCGPDQTKTQTKVLGHSLVRSLVCSHCSLVHLRRTTRFARALRCTHSLARSLTSVIPLLVVQ